MLYENGAIHIFRGDAFGYTAGVKGSESVPYEVAVSLSHYDRGNCTCYLGRNGELCKQMVAVALYAVKRGEKITEEEKRLVVSPVSSGKLSELSREGFAEVKRFVTAALRYIKTYNGPSSTWFSYQDSLSEGCSRLASIISELPVSEQTARLLVSLLLRLDEKISRGGIDGSDGTVGECMEETVLVLQEYTRLDSSCVKAFDILKDKKTCFGREEPLLKMRKSG